MTRLTRGILAAACAFALTGCGAGDDAASGTSTPESTGPALAAGTIPPTGPATPGEATIGPDGMYNYAAIPDFTPMDPCIGPWREAASRAGFEQREFDLDHMPFAQTPMCMLSSTDGTTVNLYGGSRGRRYRSKEPDTIITDRREGDRTWYIIDSGRASGLELCGAAIDLPTGTVGVSTGYSSNSETRTRESICTKMEQSLLKIWGEFQ